jgi:hypothetical protein
MQSPTTRRYSFLLSCRLHRRRRSQWAISSRRLVPAGRFRP